ncbi:hypothetical protein NDU88_008162 [Pleurodeles waltl]|uniref:Uncharacterized protein n=1 Tax=Pleurodeles waltl TaxID=8319 RepID=A0AAV7PRB2_PLEWA|nr:hypothetical protein NDU88_008162 [Pleurodeles waltl]
MFETVVVQKLKELAPKNQWQNDNGSKLEREAIYHLQRDKSIVIRQSDKGGNVVILSREMFLEEGYRQLNDKECYESAEYSIVSTLGFRYFTFYPRYIRTLTDLRGDQ